MKNKIILKKKPLQEMEMKEYYTHIKLKTSSTKQRTVTMSNNNMNDFIKYIKFLLNDAVQKREKARGTGVYLAENIDRYYMNVGEILLLQKICKEIGINIEQYNPYETEEDDNKYNYCSAAGAIGIKDGNNE